MFWFEVFWWFEFGSWFQSAVNLWGLSLIGASKKSTNFAVPKSKLRNLVGSLGAPACMHK